MANTLTLFTTTNLIKECIIHCLTTIKKTQRKRASYAHAFSSVKRVLGHFQWDQGLMNVTESTQKN